MSRLSAACLASCVLAACSVTPSGPCDTDAQCTPPAACDTGRHLCVLPCEPKCGIGEVCLSAKCTQQGPIVKSVSAPTTWTKRAGNVAVTASIDSGTNATTQSAALHVTGHPDVAGTTSDTGQVRTYTFSVPATYQTAGSDTPLAFTVDAVDNAGHATQTNAVGNGQLLIDDKAPVVNGVTINGGVTATDGLKWFAQSATAPIDAQVSLQDGSGSGVNTSSLHLSAGGTQLDTGTPTCGTGSPIVCHFSIPAGTPAIASGAQGEVQFSVTGTDNAGNNFAGNTAAFGIDGKAPTITFTATYPADGANCVSVHDGSFYCGHDGSHFWRSGDPNELPFTASDSTGSTDKGSGPDQGSGTCAIAGASTCVVRFDTATSTFRVAANFATATFTTSQDGTGTVSVTVNAKDAVGNAAAPVTIPDVAVTRVKWMRQVSAASLVGGTILSQQVGQVIVGGTVSAGGDPIQAIKIADGSLAWKAGSGLVPAVTTISANMLLDPTSSSDTAHPTPVLYVNGVDNAYALHIGSSGIDKSCVLSVPGAIGAPVLFGAGAGGQAVVAGTFSTHGYQLNAAGGACTEPPPRADFGTALNHPTLGPPSANGTTVYMGYDNTANVANDVGLKSIQFSGTAFGAIATGAIGKQPKNNVGVDAPTPASDVFFEVDLDHVAYRYTTDFATRVWTSSPALTTSNIFSQPLVSGSLMFLSAVQLVGFNVSDGVSPGAPTTPWVFPASGVGRVSPPTFGMNATFISDSSNKEMVAFDPATRAQIWSYKGSGSTAPSTQLSSIATEAALATDGVLYFGDSAGHVYALITDTTPKATAAGDWPRTGYDNCNSNHAGNTGFTCQ